MTERRAGSYESASFLSHAETPRGLALALYPRFSCGVQRKPTRAVAGFLMGGLPLPRFGAVIGGNCTHNKSVDKSPVLVFNVRTLNQGREMYNITQAYTVTTTCHGKHVATHDFNGKADAVSWFTKASTDPEWFGPGFKVCLGIVAVF